MGFIAYWNFEINLSIYLYNKTILPFSLSENQVVFTNSVDPDDKSHYAEFHLALHYLQKYASTHSGLIL